MPFYLNIFILYTTLPTTLHQPQDGKNLVPISSATLIPRTLKKVIEIQNYQNPSKTRNSKTFETTTIFRTIKIHQTIDTTTKFQTSNPSKSGTSETFKITTIVQTSAI